MNKFQAKRLLRLAAFLRKLPRHRFSYAKWVGADWEGKQDLSCGTTACALGWAATMPFFRKIGLHIRKSSFLEALPVLEEPDTGKRYTGFSAVIRIFGPDTGNLFTPNNAGLYTPSSSPATVARRMRLFVQRQFPELLPKPKRRRRK